MEDFAEGSSFHRVLNDHDTDELTNPKEMKRVVLCSGKVYYDLLEERRKRNIKNITIMRVEQLYPFPDDVLKEELAPYTNAEIIWCQEEHKNMGAWYFINPRLEDVLVDMKHKAGRPRYVGRDEAASPATGSLKIHNQQQAKLVDEALTL